MRTRCLRRDRLRARARGDIGDDDRDDDEEDEGRDVGRVGDGEGVDRRQEEEVVAERRGDARQQRRPQAEAHRDADDGGQKHQIDVLDAEPRLDQLAEPERRRRPPRSASDIGTRLERLGLLGRARPSSLAIGSPATWSPAMT